MTPITIDNLQVTTGPTWRSTTIGDTTVNVWVDKMSTDWKRGTYIATMCRGDIVQHLKLPSEILHLDRAFEHACQYVIEDIAKREAARAALALVPDHEGEIDTSDDLCWLCLGRGPACKCPDDRDGK